MMMNYRPKVVIGKVKNTGWPIDGHELALALWDYDKHESYHLWSWADESDEAMMQTMYQTEQEAGICVFGSLEDFAAAWKANEYENDGVFLIPIENVEVLEVVQEEQKAGAKTNEWISVKDRLPEDCKEYLVVTAGGQVAILRYLAKEDDLADCFEHPGGAWIRCTHWMPLPAPPEGE